MRILAEVEPATKVILHSPNGFELFDKSSNWFGALCRKTTSDRKELPGSVQAADASVPQYSAGGTQLDESIEIE